MRDKEEAAYADWDLVHDEPGRSVRRYPVPGGWLYQCEGDIDTITVDGVKLHGRSWGNPAFVASARVVDARLRCRDGEVGDIATGDRCRRCGRVAWEHATLTVAEVPR